MKQVTDNYLAKMEDTLRTYIPRLTIDGVELDGDLQTGMTINLGSCGSETFGIGSVFIPSISASISDCTTKLQDKELLLEMGLVIADGEVEYVPVGYFTVEKPNTKKNVTTFTAYGRLMSKGGAFYASTLTYPTTLQNVIDEISNVMGVTIVLNGLTAEGIINKPISGELCRNALAYVGGLLGGFVTENSAGNIVISKYALNKAVTIDTDLCYEYPESNDDAYTVTGLEVIVKEEGSEEDGTTVEGEKYASDTDINVVTLNPYMNQGLFESCEANIVGFSYLPTTVRFLGDIRLEPWDSIVVMDDEETIDVPCMSISHVWDGGLVTTISAPGTTNSENEGNYQGPMVARVEKTYLKTLVLEQMVAQKVDAEYIKTNYLEANNFHVKGASTFDGQLIANAGSRIGSFVIDPEGLRSAYDYIYAKYDYQNNAFSEDMIIREVENYPYIGLLTDFIDIRMLDSYSISAGSPSVDWPYADFKASAGDNYYMTNITKVTLKMVLLYSNDGETVSAVGSTLSISDTEKVGTIGATNKYVAFGFCVVATGKRVYIPNPASSTIEDYPIDFFSDTYSNIDATYALLITTFKPKLILNAIQGGNVKITSLAFKYGSFIVNCLGEVFVEDAELEELWSANMV